MLCRGFKMLALALAWSAWLPVSLAQAPRSSAYRAPSQMPQALVAAARATPRSERQSRTAPDDWRAAELAGTYGIRRASAAGESRPYLREPPTPRPDANPVFVPAQRRDYFPGLRAGQGPNRNVVDTRHLCVPGRRAFVYGFASR